METAVIDLALKVIKIIIIDLLLSGDNAIVIAMATLRLSPKSRKKAILLGTSGAIALRILLTCAGTVLLTIPLLQFLGGLVLIWVTSRLLIDTFSREAQNANVDSPTRLIHAIKIIIIADFSMSLDNILAISGASHGEIRLVIFGLLLSIPILMFFSQKIAVFMEKYPLLVYVGAIILSWVSAELICSDRIVGQYISKLVISIAIVVCVFVISKIKFYLIKIR